MKRTSSRLKTALLPLIDQIVFSSQPYVQLKNAQIQAVNYAMNSSVQILDDTHKPLTDVLPLIQPLSDSEVRLVRVGNEGDGGYVMADFFEVSAAVSIGIGTNASWDLEIAEKHIPVFMFDHTIRRPPGEIPGGKFRRIGVGNPQKSRRFRHLATVIEEVQEKKPGNLLLKMDIEGCEWGVLEKTTTQDLATCSQIVLEMHGFAALHDLNFRDRVMAVLEKLRNSHLPVHVHGNNFDELVMFGDKWFPSTVEVSYVRRDLLGQDLHPASLESTLDCACDPRVQDIDLRFLESFIVRNGLT